MAAKVINIRGDQPGFPELSTRDPDVTTIIIGESPTSSDAAVLPVDDLPLFQTEFPHLSHLYLWCVTNCETVPDLGARQRWLEIRSCPDVVAIDSLPLSLEAIIIEDCPRLTQLPEIRGQQQFAQLRELSLAGSAAVDHDWIDRLIRAAPNLRQLDLSRCPQIEKLPPRLPKQLERLELNACTSLKKLPADWPLSLRRIGLRGASSITFVPALPKTADYVDLALTTSLLKLPRLPPLPAGAEPAEIKPRTLFLFGSGVLEPPASEHGETADSNVALETREYQDEVALVGKGTVKRCKLLLLGNGAAGKTALALDLNPNFTQQDHPGTTHGVQFWDWPDFEAESSDATSLVNLHMWDFGGQEIYHSTHRLFVSRGSIFIVVWNPDQDGKKPPPQGGLQDVWMPVRYWLDYIHTESPHNRPLIAIVGAHQGGRWEERKPELRDRLRGQIGDEYADRVPLFLFDSIARLGERDDLERWLQEAVSKVVETQGTIVPTYWEVAQDLVEAWLPAPRDRGTDRSVKAAHTRLSMEQFTDKLKARIESELQPPYEGTDLTDLRQQWHGGAFLTERRVERTLRFLTRSGWLYWDPSLFDAGVIIDQPWALEKVYTTLERRERSHVYKQLMARHGRFTFADLRAWCWEGSELDEGDQRLILSFMLSVGVCFRLSRGYGAEAEVYISPTHLPLAADMGNQFDLPAGQSSAEPPVTSKQLHRGHWFALLRALCNRYGDSGTYARDACLIRGSTYRWNREHGDWSARLRFQLDDETKGLGGQIDIQVAGQQVSQRLSDLKQYVESFLPGYAGNPSDAALRFDQEFHGCVEDAKTVFFSFTWNPVDKHIDYEEPVDAVYHELLRYQEQGRVKLLRDKHSIKPGDYISEYVANAKSQDVDLVILFTSDKYWRSWWCMLEFHWLLESLARKGKSIEESVLVIEHETAELLTVEQLAPVVNYWEQLPLEELSGRTYPKNYPQQLMSQNWSYLRDNFVNSLKSNRLTSDIPGIRQQWHPDKKMEIVDWVKAKIGLRD